MTKTHISIIGGLVIDYIDEHMTWNYYAFGSFYLSKAIVISLEEKYGIHTTVEKIASLKDNQIFKKELITKILSNIKKAGKGELSLDLAECGEDYVTLIIGLYDIYEWPELKTILKSLKQ